MGAALVVSRIASHPKTTKAVRTPRTPKAVAFSHAYFCPTLICTRFNKTKNPNKKELTMVNTIPENPAAKIIIDGLFVLSEVNPEEEEMHPRGRFI